MICRNEHDVSFVPLTEDKLEIVRQWRNSEPIRKQMEFQDIITAEMQKEWFDSVNNEHNYYSIVVWKGKEIGLINVKNIDYDTKSGEGGLFIADPAYIDSVIPVKVTLHSLDICFGDMGLEVMYAKVADDNCRAGKLVTAFGYEPVSENPHGRFRYYILTKQSYYQRREYLIDLLYGTE